MGIKILTKRELEAQVAFLEAQIAKQQREFDERLARANANFGKVTEEKAALERQLAGLDPAFVREARQAMVERDAYKRAFDELLEKVLARLGPRKKRA